LYDSLSSDPPFYLMPLAIATLHEDIQNDRTLKGGFINVLYDIIAGLEEMHSMKIFHRDLKPTNVLRFRGSPDEKRDYYAISDFGLMAINQTNISTLTQTGMRKSSDYYTAPEIVKDLKRASAQTDIYSLGCILHDFIGIEERIPCNEIKETGEFAGIMLNCTRIEPTRRFRSVTILRDTLLSLGNVSIVPKTQKGASIFKLLTDEDYLINEEEWKNIVEFIEDEYGSIDAFAALGKLTIHHIDEVIEKYPSMAERLGIIYAKWIKGHSFNFVECDGLAVRLKKFIINCGINIQSECLMSLLYLGTNHNRYYVEEMFVRLVGNNLDDNLAKRLAIEFRVDDIEVCTAFRHFGRSINYNVNNLHPLLLKTLTEICS